MPKTIGGATEAQGKVLAIVPKIPAAVSFLGSAYITYDVLRMPRDKRKLYHRLLLGMSVSDCSASAAWFMTTWPIPPEVLPVYGASGTQQTCTAQGYFTQLSIITILYNAGLALYYYFVIKQGWTDIKLTKSRVEYVLHTVPVLWGVMTSSVSAGLGLINPIGWDCWISAIPLGCKESWLRGYTTCTRGDNAHLFQWIFYYIPLWMVILGVTIVMGSIVMKFWKQEKANDRYSTVLIMSGGSPNSARPLTKTKRKRARETMRQGMFYIGSFIAVYFWPTVLWIHEVTSEGDDPYYFLVLLSALMIPSQGIWNCFIYIRPRYKQIQAERRRQKLREQRLKPNRQKGRLTGGATGMNVTVSTLKTTTSHENSQEAKDTSPKNLFMAANYNYVPKPKQVVSCTNKTEISTMTRHTANDNSQEETQDI